MSRNNYNNNNNNNELSLRPTTSPMEDYSNNQRRRGGGGFYRGNRNNYQNRNYNGNRNNNNFYHRNNTFYNQNFQRRYNRTNDDNRRDYEYDNQNYRRINGRQPLRNRFNEDRRAGGSRSRERPQQRKKRPQQLRLNDFMPPHLRDVSPSNISNLPSDFNLNSVTNTRPTTPENGLPQRRIFSTQTITTNDTTQPFDVHHDSNNNLNQEQERKTTTTTTTASYRRRQRRIRQEQYRNIGNNYHDNNYNRFGVLEDEDPNTDVESNYENDAVPSSDNNNNQKKKKTDFKQNLNKKKQKIYLEPNRILRYMQDHASNIIGARGNQAYVLASTPVYDEWVRNNYDLQIWQTYLKMGTQDKHWAKEVIQRTKKRDDLINSRFIQKKINQLTTNIAQANAAISNLQVQLGTYWSQTTPGATALNTSSTTTTNMNRIREPIDRLEKSVLKYIQHCTQHVKKMSEKKIQLAKAQMEEYKALENFEQVATPVQQNIHLMLKPKMKLWSTKNKNYQIAMKRVEYDLPPKFISKIDFTFKLDESILNREEAQILYNQMRQLTKDYRAQTMSLYLQSITREKEILSNDIKQIIEGFPKENDDEELDADPGYLAFKYYDELREKRLNLEAEQSIYFLEKQRVEGEIKEQEEIIAPTLTRSLGEDFSLQL
jgi:hypothetical protein